MKQTVPQDIIFKPEFVTSWENFGIIMRIAAFDRVTGKVVGVCTDFKISDYNSGELIPESAKIEIPYETMEEVVGRLISMGVRPKNMSKVEGSAKDEHIKDLRGVMGRLMKRFVDK